MKQTLVLCKPDAVERGLVGEIISRFEQKGMKIRGLIGVEVREIEAEPNQRSPEISLPLRRPQASPLSLSAIRKHLGVKLSTQKKRM